MATPSPVTPTAPVDLVDETATPTLRVLGLRGLLVTLPAALTCVSMVWGATQGIFAGLQLQRIDPDNKVINLAWLVGLSTLCTTIAAPAIGALSDRTRTRWGGRLPWMLAGAGLAVAASALMAFAHSVIMIGFAYIVIQIATNLINTPANAFVPDKVPVARRGIFSAAIGLSALAGATLGSVAGAAFSDAVVTGYIAVTTLLALAVGVFALVNRRGVDNRTEPAEPYRRKDLLSTYWVNPAEHPEFAWAFAGRFLLYSGYFAIGGYQLYILQDYIGLSESKAVHMVPLLGGLGLVGLVIAIPLVGTLSDRTGRVKVFVLLASVILAIGVLIPVFWPTPVGMVIESVIAGLGFGAYTAVDFALITRVLPSDQDHGKDLGLINITTALPQTIAAAVAGIVVTSLGGFRPLFIIAAVCALVGALSLRFIKSVR